MNRITALLLVVFLLISSSAMAFDGNRKGFVLGGGLGFAPTIKKESELYGRTFAYEESGIGVNFFLGFAWDEANMLVYEGNVASFTVSSYEKTQGISAITWYHYYGPMGKSFFTVAGLGLYSYDTKGADGATGKTGILAGLGYEFARHWQVGFYVSSGKTKYNIEEIEHTTVSLLIGGVAF